ncbi:MAG TPA: hypothetical protein VE263_06220 [Candidatus Angelobacter sp.]|nr:hypothetical protein [Candidatus Angelobacter sp.]
MTITRTLARRMAITDLTGSLAACLSARAPGITDIGEAAATMVVDTMDEDITAAAATTEVVGIMEAVAITAVAASQADAEALAAVEVSTAEAGFTVAEVMEAGLTVEADLTAEAMVVEATAGIAKELRFQR